MAIIKFGVFHKNEDVWKLFLKTKNKKQKPCLLEIEY